MRRARKPNPTLAAEFHPKSRSVSQVPRNSLPANLDAPAASVLTNPILANFQKERTRPSLAQPRTDRAKTLNRKSLDPSLRLPLSRKPRRPNLHRQPLQIPRARTPPAPDSSANT